MAKLEGKVAHDEQAEASRLLAGFCNRWAIASTLSLDTLSLDPLTGSACCGTFRIVAISGTIRNNSPTVKAVQRAIDILMSFTSQQPELSLAEVSARVHQNKSTVRRLLVTLAKGGLVAQDPFTRRYGLGMQIQRLATAYPWHTQISSKALPYMRELRDLSGETVSLHVIINDQCISVEKVESFHEMRTTSQIGKPLPWGVGATTKAMLAHMDEGQDQSKLKSLVAASRRGAGTFQRLVQELDEVRRRGFVMSVNEAAPGASAVAAPVLDAEGKALAAMTISGPSTRFTEERRLACASHLRKRAEELSRLLQGQGKETR